MAERVICIDLGSSYTKVCLRPAGDAAARPLTFPRLADELKMCVPSTVLVDRAAGTATCGPRAADRKPDPRYEIHSNWKRRLFAGGPTAAGPPADPLAAFLRSDAVRRLAADQQVTADQLDRLLALLAAARGLTADGPLPPPSGATVAPPEAVALAFFRYLRQTVMEQCQRLGLTDAEAVPAVVCVPALDYEGSADLTAVPAVRTLLGCVERAGWPLHPDGGVLTEPYANAVGILTKGANHRLKTGRLSVAQMFDKGPLAQVLRDPKTHPSYRGLVVDVGSFTTDFAAVTLDTGGGVVDDPLAECQVSARSLACGVYDLDGRVLDTLPSSAAGFLRNLSESEWHPFRVNLYSEGRPLVSGEAGEVPDRATMPSVRRTVEQFAREVGDRTAEYCRGLPHLPPGGLQELILTGGGNNIPAVREAVRYGVLAAGQPTVKTFWSGPTSTQTDPPVKQIKDPLVRAGSAVGGASIYFDKAFW